MKEKKPIKKLSLPETKTKKLAKTLSSLFLKIKPQQQSC
jgi:hypothetical protein